MTSSIGRPDSRCQINAIAANAATPRIHLTLRLRRDVCFFFSTRREFPPARDGCMELHGSASGRRKKNFRTSFKSIVCTSSSPTGWCHCHHDTTSHYAARSVGVSVLSIERRCRSFVWHRHKVRYRSLYLSATRGIGSKTTCVPESPPPARYGTV